MFRLFAVIFFIAFFGCASEEPRGTVTGKVAVDGIPLTEGTIYFENQNKGVALTGQIKSDGSFKLASHQGAGLVVGSYKVAISPEAMLMSADEIPLVGKNPRKPNDVKKSPLPEKYFKTSTSELSAEIKEGFNPPIFFDLKK
ncbi:MAG: carboxypeptidase regulatory-like domain-containing protein [Planctomycetes bacterium]|nr:carboxypeptidase regulatory-like domain-containing protein [Planctomycetota bacterium]